MARSTADDPRDLEIAKLTKRITELEERCASADRRVARYQIAFCRFQTVIADLCSADEYIGREGALMMRKT